MNKFIERYKKQIDDFKLIELENILKTIRIINKDKISKEILRKLNKIEENIYEFNGKFNLSSTSEYLNGDLFIQALPSYHTIKLLDPKENEIILDMCASPGSKTILISELMKNKGTIIALDKDKRRIDKLKSNIEKNKCQNVIAIQKDARYFESTVSFDKILLDVPCSGNYSVEENWFEKRTISDIKEKSKLQKELINNANKLLKKDGILIYSTCSLEIEEDEENSKFIEKLGYKKIFEKKYWPHKDKTIGFYLTKFKKIK